MRKIILVSVGILVLVLALFLTGCVYEPLDTNLRTQNIYPITNNLYDIGSPLLNYQDGYFMNLYINGVAIAGSQWVNDANGINYSSGSIGINTPSVATSLVKIYSNSGTKSQPVLSVSDNTASSGATVIYAGTAGAKSDHTTTMQVDNYATSGTAGKNKYGIRITSGSVWNGAGSTNYGLYIDEPVGGTNKVGAYIGGSIDWASGNVIYIPLDGDIQTYVDNATAGDTLILASGVYTITSKITINKQLNIKGQGSSGFLTSPITPSHGTLIYSTTTLPDGAIDITNDNVRISDLSMYLTGASSIGVNTANNLKGIVLRNMDVIVTCTGYAQGFTIYGSDTVMRDLTFYISSTNNGASGLWLWNDSSTTQDCVIDCFNVTGTVVGAGSYAYAFVCENINDANTLTMNLSNSVCKSLTGTPLDIAVASISTTTNTAIVNAYMCTFDGADYDAYQTGTNQLNVGGSVLVNDKHFGTITYRATMVSNKGLFSTVKITGLSAYANNAAAIAGGLVAGDLYRTGGDPDLVCVVH